MFKKHLFLLLSLVGVSLSAQADEDINYTLAPGDTISISVYGEDDLSIKELQIDIREIIEYPYLDKISTKGKTLNQLQEEITNGLKGRVLIHPKVSVTIFEYRNFYVNGVVNKPGGYEYEPGLTVEKAVSLAGGFVAQYRKSKGIYITRASETKHMSEEELIEYLDTQEESRTSDKVGPGDSIYVVSSLFGGR